MKNNNFLQGIFLYVNLIFIYFFTTIPLTRNYSFTLLILLLLTILILTIFGKLKNAVTGYIIIDIVLLIVGITGWFFSPLFSWIYILSLALSFLFNNTVSNSFILILVFIFLPNLGSIDLNIDILSLSSLLLLIPLNQFLRGEYLKLRENEKSILILKEEHKQYKDKLSEILANKVSKISVDIKQPLNDVRLIALYEQKKDKKNRIYSKIITLIDSSIKYLKDFEETVTGVKLSHSPKKIK